MTRSKVIVDEETGEVKKYYDDREPEDYYGV